MVRVEFLGPIGLEAMEFEVKNLSELKTQLQAIHGLEEWLKISAIAINEKIIHDINTPLKDGDKIVILPPVCGG